MDEIKMKIWERRADANAAELIDLTEKGQNLG